MSIPYSQKDWDAAAVRWRGKDGVTYLPIYATPAFLEGI